MPAGDANAAMPPQTAGQGWSLNPTGQMPAMPQGPIGVPGAAPPMAGNPMFAMMQMMQMMMGGSMAGSMVDPAAVPFSGSPAVADNDLGLDAEIIRPATLEPLLKTQRALQVGSILDSLCLSDDGKQALGGIPEGCTIAFAGPPGTGKTRTALVALARVAQLGGKVAYVVAEEGFHDDASSGRDDLCSRMTKIGMATTGLDESAFKAEVLDNIYVLQSQYHKGQSWDDFVTKYRYLVERESITFVVVDSLNTLDPTRNRTADNLSALKTYNHQHGVTCICVGQIRDSGAPVGGEAVQHTADAVFLVELMTLGSKEIAALWGGKYRDQIPVIRAIKSITTPIFPHPVRVDRAADTGALVPHADQPVEFALPS